MTAKIDKSNESRKAAKAAKPAARVLDPEAERLRRQTLAEMNRVLANKRCPHCSIVGCWDIESTEGRIRNVKCKACNKPSSAPIIVKENTNGKSQANSIQQ